MGNFEFALAMFFFWSVAMLFVGYGIGYMAAAIEINKLKNEGKK